MHGAHQSQERPPALIVAGAFETPTRKVNSMEWFTNPFLFAENLAMSDTSSRYQNLGRRVLNCDLSEGMIAPNMGTMAGMGIQPVHRSFNEIYREAEAAILAKISPQTSPERRAYLIGHSLGGSIATIVAHKNPELFAAIITIGSPHDGIDEASDKAFTHLNGPLRQATASIERCRQVLGDKAPLLYAVASRRDEIVSPASAMPAMADYHMPFEHHRNLRHVDMMRDEAIVEFCGQVVAGARFSNLPQAA